MTTWKKQCKVVISREMILDAMNITYPWKESSHIDWSQRLLWLYSLTIDIFSFILFYFLNLKALQPQIRLAFDSANQKFYFFEFCTVELACLRFYTLSTVFQLFNGDSSQILVSWIIYNQYLISPIS